jgi:hypothetical protein
MDLWFSSSVYVEGDIEIRVYNDSISGEVKNIPEICVRRDGMSTSNAPPPPPFSRPSIVVIIITTEFKEVLVYSFWYHPASCNTNIWQAVLLKFQCCLEISRLVSFRLKINDFC